MFITYKLKGSMVSMVSKVVIVVTG